MIMVVLASAGFCVLAYGGLKVFLGVRSLGLELERTRHRLEPHQAELKRQVDALKRRAE